MIRSISIIGLALVMGAGIGCGNNEDSQAQAEQAAQQLAQAMEQAAQQQQQAAQQVQQAQQGAQQPAAAGGGDSNFGTVSLNPGFMPDPHVASGTSGGNLQASSWNASCTGWVTQTPDHLFVAGGQFAALRIVAHSPNDTALVVQKPDGSYQCNDDSDGLNPMVVLANAPAGTYKVWIASYEQGANYAYRVGFSELSGTTPSTIAQ